MKNVLFGILVGLMCFTYSPNISAQTEAGFAPKHFYADIGIGVPVRPHSLGLYSKRLPAFTGNFQYGFDMFSAGLYVGYTHYKYTNYSFDNYDDYHDNDYYGVGKPNVRSSRLSVGASFSWHVWYFLNHKLDLDLGVEPLDLYVTVLLGANIDTRKEINTGYKTVSPYPFFAMKVGAKYYFLKNLGAFLEIGGGLNPVSYASIGLAFKF